MNFLDSLAEYLRQNTQHQVYAEYLPDKPDNVVAFFVYGNIPATDKSLTRYTQIQVRGLDHAETYEEATRLSHLLDSGSEEELIDIGGGWLVHCTPTRRPKSFGQDNLKRITYYFEVAIWGDDRA